MKDFCNVGIRGHTLSRTMIAQLNVGGICSVYITEAMHNLYEHGLTWHSKPENHSHQAEEEVLATDMPSLWTHRKKRHYAWHIISMQTHFNPLVATLIALALNLQ